MNYKKNKQELVLRAKKHYEADTIVRGMYWNGVMGNCVGCLAEKRGIERPHEYLAEFSGVPVWVFDLADTIHVGLALEDNKYWVVSFSEAINVTPDDDETFWSDSLNLWRIVVMDECLRNKEGWEKQDVKDRYVSKVVSVLEQVKEGAIKELDGEQVDWQEIQSAGSAAWSAQSTWSDRSATLPAAWSAASAVESAVWSADSSAAESDVWSAIWSAWSAARSAESAAWSAAWSAESVARSAAESDVWSADSSARYAAFKRMSKELIKILRRKEEEFSDE